jgi:hypothetical protein
VGCLLLVVLLVVAIVGGFVVLSRSSLGKGLGAAVAIYDHGRPQISRTYYYESTGQPPTMQVFLSVGVDPALAGGIGCGVVRTELSNAGLSGVRWVVFAGNGQPVSQSDTTTCP